MLQITGQGQSGAGQSGAVQSRQSDVNEAFARLDACTNELTQVSDQTIKSVQNVLVPEIQPPGGETPKVPSPNRSSVAITIHRYCDQLQTVTAGLRNVNSRIQL